MSVSPPTRPSLLIALRDVENNRAWGEFVEIYTPLIFGHCMKRGLQEADAADVAQEVMRAVAAAIRKFEYDRQRGTFRAWLLTVTRSKMNNFFTQHARQPQSPGETEVRERLEAEPDGRDATDWETEYRQRLFEYAAEKVRGEFQDKTWQAFWKTAVENAPVGEVAAGLGLSQGAVYIARSRVIARLREQIEAISDERELLDAFS